jgi:hypothetical protein
LCKAESHIKKMRRVIPFLLFPALLLGACAPAGFPIAGAAPGATASSAAAAVPSATIDWFPATATWTPFPTAIASPTIESRPGLGAQTFADDFADPKVWQDAKTEGDGTNNAIVNRNRLTLAANVPPVYLFTLRNDLQLTNFSAEVSVNVNRCTGTDAYGMLFRAAGNANSYRYMLACNGQVRVERLQAGKVSVLQDWLPSGDAPPGAPGQVRLGVWTAGVELRFFLNDHFQFTVIDPVFHNGTLGFFVTAGNSAGMNVSFSDLQVRGVTYVSPTPTATPRKTATPTRTPRP